MHSPSQSYYLFIFKSRFAANTEINFEQVNGTRGYNQVGVFMIKLCLEFNRDRVQVNLNNGSVHLALAEGVMHDVFVSSIVGGGEY